MSGRIATLIRGNRMKSGFGTNKSRDYLSPYQGTLAQVSRLNGLGAGHPPTSSISAGVGVSQPSRPPSTLVNPLDSDRRIAAVLFDLDGTLYDQRRMRALMEIGRASC